MEIVLRVELAREDASSIGFTVAEETSDDGISLAMDQLLTRLKGLLAPTGIVSNGVVAGDTSISRDKPASIKQRNFIRHLGRNRRGLNGEDLELWLKEKFGCDFNTMTSKEARRAIGLMKGE